MKRLMMIGTAVVAASCTYANTQNWSANPVSAEWSTTAANWDGGMAWTQTNTAVFGESAVPELCEVAKIGQEGNAQVPKGAKPAHGVARGRQPWKKSGNLH